MAFPPVLISRRLAIFTVSALVVLTALMAGLFVEMRRMASRMSRSEEESRARDAELQRGLKRAEAHILNLYKASDGPASATPEAPQRWRHAAISNVPQEFVIHTDAPTGGVISFRNTGETRIQDVQMSVNDRRWFRSMEDAKRIVAGAEGDREKAMRLWQYVCEHSYPWLPPDVNGPESRSAVKCLSVYGYGDSGALGNALAALARTAGIRSRLRDLRGHIVPELFFDGGWRVLDPTYEVFYPDPDNGGQLAGVDDLAADAELARRVVPPSGGDASALAELYRSEPNPEDASAIFTTTPVGFRLAPGDEIDFHWAPIHALRVQREQRGVDPSLRVWEEPPGTIPWHATVYAARPPYLNRAVFRNAPLSSRAAVKSLLLDTMRAEEFVPPSPRGKTASRLMLTPGEALKAGRATLFVSLPLVITEGRVTGTFAPSSAGDTCVVSVWSDDEELRRVELKAAETVRPQSFALAIGALLSGPKRAARYGYAARIVLTMKEPGRGGVYDLRAETHGQVTPFTPWRLNHGENRIQARAVGEHARCEAHFVWREARAAPHVLEAPGRVRTEPGIEERVAFHWDAPATSEGRPPDFYETQLSERADFAWPAVAGGFVEMPADSPTWTAPFPFPPRPGTYYFRVRGKNLFGHPGPWSAVLSFETP